MLPVVDDTGVGLVVGQFDRLVQQRFVVYHLAALHTAVGAHDHFRLEQHPQK